MSYFFHISSWAIVYFESLLESVGCHEIVVDVYLRRYIELVLEKIGAKEFVTDHQTIVDFVLEKIGASESITDHMFFRELLIEVIGSLESVHDLQHYIMSFLSKSDCMISVSDKEHYIHILELLIAAKVTEAEFEFSKMNAGQRIIYGSVKEGAGSRPRVTGLVHGAR